MAQFLWHGAECAFWCFVWHKLAHKAPTVPEAFNWRASAFRNGRMKL